MISILQSSSPTALTATSLVLPMPVAAVRAGFPSPAEDFAVNRLDLTQLLITHPQATFLLRVAGASMREAGIDDGDTLVVDRAIKPRHGHIVVAVVDGDFPPFWETVNWSAQTVNGHLGWENCLQQHPGLSKHGAGTGTIGSLAS